MNSYDILNHLLVELFKDITSIEEKAVITPEFGDITNNDMHIIEAIGRNSSKNMSTVAKTLSVTVGTLTIAVNNLVKKDYVRRVRSDQDRRVVLISLTEKGRRAYDHHKSFHQKMISSVLGEFSDEETAVLVKALKNLTEFFHQYKS